MYFKLLEKLPLEVVMELLLQSLLFMAMLLADEVPILGAVLFHLESHKIWRC
jgi:hypothetical protein